MDRLPSAVSWILVVCCFFLSPRAQCQESAPWPRSYTQGSDTLVVYQPQIDSWENYETIHFRSAFSLTTSSAKNSPVYGILAGTAKTNTDMNRRSVEMTNLTFEVRSPSVDEASQARIGNTVQRLLPKRSKLDLSLDRLLAYLKKAPVQQRAVEVNLEPPPIFYSDRPAALIVFLGQPAFRPIGKGSLTVAVNSNRDIFSDPEKGDYFLLLDNSWLSSKDPMKNDWSQVKTLPQSLWSLPDEPRFTAVKKSLPGKPLKTKLRFFTTTEPAELILTAGAPTFTPIPPTRLMLASNASAPLLFHTAQTRYYLLSAGRWFAANNLNGPWDAATTTLPSEFSEIPLDSPASFVRASVPGTEEAKDAILLASLPKTAVVERSKAKLDVSYDGNPEFTSIPQTSVSYAVNTPYDVFLINGRYYACNNAIWFSAPDPLGPWMVADSVPEAIYTIPSSNPKHNVTYVYVKESTPDTVVVTQTAGYSGEYVATTGLLMFGAGVAIGAAISDEHHHDYYYYPPPYYSYGASSIYNYPKGGYYHSASFGGPAYGGGSRGYYNPWTGGYAHSSWQYGPGTASFSKAGYNPWTDRYGARTGGINSSGAWSRGVVATDDGWASGGRKVTSQGSAAGFRTSQDQGAVRVKSGGQSGFVGHSGDDVYAGKDGQIYKRDDNGDWSKRTGGDWQSVNRDSPNAARNEQVRSQLSTDAQARSRGQQLSSSYQRDSSPKSWDSISNPWSRGGNQQGGSLSTSQRGQFQAGGEMRGSGGGFRGGGRGRR